MRFHCATWLASALALHLGGCGDDDGSTISMVTNPTSSGESGADGTAASDSATSDPDSTSGIDPGTGDAADATSDGEGSMWSVTVSGAFEGTASGVIVTVNVAEPTTIARVVFGGNTVLTGTYQYDPADPPTGEKMMLAFDIRFDDGTECRTAPPAATVFAEVIDGSEESYEATFSGMIRCDGDVDATVTGFIRV